MTNYMSVESCYIQILPENISLSEDLKIKLNPCMVVSITDAILGPYSFSLRWPYPGLYCTVNHFSVIKGFVLNS